MENRARSLASDAINNHAGWVSGLGRSPVDPTGQRRWLHAVATVAAYRDRWNITDDQRPLGHQPAATVEQAHQHTRATRAAQAAVRISETSRPPTTHDPQGAGIAAPGHSQAVDM